jgi:metal-responsive CopG/Arc/MetJ family transcriptional regulator
MKRKQIEILDVDYPMQRVSFEIDPQAVWHIDEIADEKGISRSEVFRQAIYCWLALSKKGKNK